MSKVKLTEDVEGNCLLALNGGIKVGSIFELYNHLGRMNNRAFMKHSENIKSWIKDFYCDGSIYDKIKDCKSSFEIKKVIGKIMGGEMGSESMFLLFAEGKDKIFFNQSRKKVGNEPGKVKPPITAAPKIEPKQVYIQPSPDILQTLKEVYGI